MVGSWLGRAGKGWETANHKKKKTIKFSRQYGIRTVRAYIQTYVPTCVHTSNIHMEAQPHFLDFFLLFFETFTEYHEISEECICVVLK